jgi:hypothetical protein
MGNCCGNKSATSQHISKKNAGFEPINYKDDLATLSTLKQE